MSNALSYNGHIVTYGGHFLNAYDPYNPLRLPDYTARLEYAVGDTPTYDSDVTAVQVSADPNIWDVTCANPIWSGNKITGFGADLIRVLGANSSHVTKMKKAFYGWVNLVSVAQFDTRNVDTMEEMFSGCTSLAIVPQQLDASNVTTTFMMFQGCSSLTTAPQLLNSSNLTTTQNMFMYSGVTTVPVFDTHNVKNMNRMFGSAASLTSVPLLDTSKVQDFEGFCDGCSSLTTVPLLDTSSASTMAYMFNECRAVTGGALALYQQASQQAHTVVFYQWAFKNCGADTTTGAAELAQIPSSWK